MVADTLTSASTLLFRSFILSLRAKNAAQRTIEGYSEAVRQLGAFLEGKGMPLALQSIRREHVETFIAELLAKWKPAIASNRYRGLMQYFRWLVEEGEIKQAPMAHEAPKDA